MKQEAWRFTSVAPIAEGSFDLAQPPARVPTLEDIRPFLLFEAGYRLVFVDGFFQRSLSTPFLDDVQSLAHVVTHRQDLVREHLGKYAATDDRPILFREGRFFLLHPPGGIIAAYRKCTHLGCAVPWNDAEDRFECPCHGSQYDKHTAVVLRTPAPKPLQLFHIARDGTDGLVVDTNPLHVIDRSGAWDPAVIEISDVLDSS